MVLGCSQTVLEHALALVYPQPRKLLAVGHLLDVAHEHTLENLCKVSQVEGVVRLGRGRKQLANNSGEHIDTGAHNIIRHLCDAALKGSQEGPQDAAKNECLGTVRHFDVTDYIEVAQEAVGDGLSATAGGTHRSDKRQVDYLAVCQVLAIIPAVLVKPLAKDLNRRLCTVGLTLGHVQVINIHVELFASAGAIDTLLALLQLGVQEVLGHVSRCVGGEGESQRDHILTHSVSR